jgi:beta-xylosidase
MYFSASISADTSKHCVGAATSSSITGPYTPEESPFACPLDQGGAIDADGYEDDDGTLYATYKIDGNSLNSDGSFHPTPIMLQKLKSDGITRDGDAVKILERGPADGPVIEAPSLVKSNGTYFLSFSSGMYNTPQYDVAYATAPSITGPYTKASERLLETADPSNVELLAGPGGSDFKGDGTMMAFHAFRNGQNISDGRAMYTTGIRLSGDTISIEGYSSLPLPGAAVPPQSTANQAARRVPFM